MQVALASKFNRGCILFALLLSFSSVSVAQVLTGEIDGTVYDKTGAAIPNATVIVKNDDQNLVIRTVETNTHGQFTVPLLPRAHYSLTVNATGFESEVRTMDVHTGIISSAAFALAPGQITQSVEVTTDTMVQVELDNAASGTLIPATKVTQLPLSSRNFQQLLSIEPGVSGGIPGGTHDRGSINSTGGVNSANYEVNGLPAQDNGYFLDGQDLQRRSAGGTQIGAYPGIDFIQEMNSQRANYGAQYGGSGSAFLSITSKSGTTAFHGTAYDFYRSEIFNANSYFDNLAGVPRPLDRYSDFGYEVGGPIWLPHVTSRRRTKTFFVVGQEFLRSASSVQATLTDVPTAQQREGIFNAPICEAYNAAGACATPGTTISTINPEAQDYLKDVIDKIPLPNSPTDPQGLIVAEPGTNNETQTFVRIDHQFNDKFSIMFRFFNDPFNLIVPSGLRVGNQAPGVGISNVTDGSRAYFGTGTYIFSPRNILQAGGGYMSSYVTAQATGTLEASNSPDVRPTLPLKATLGRIPNLIIASSTYEAISPYDNQEPVTQLFANDTEILGRHTLTFGFNVEYQKAGNNVGQTNAGQFTFSSTAIPKAPPGTKAATQFDQAFANFLDGSVQSFQQLAPDPSAFPHSNIYEEYLQDDFRASPNLTLNMGLRYSYFASPSSGTLKGLPYLPFVNFVPGRFQAADAPAVSPNGLLCTSAPCDGGLTPNPNYNPENGLIIANKTSPYGSKVTTQPYLTFAPRIGFAYDVGGRGSTSIRGGFGIYYIQLPTPDYHDLASDNEPNVTSLTIPDTTFTNPGAGFVSKNPAPLVLKAAQVNWQSPYVEAYSLDLQHTLWGGTLLDIGYYANRALHLAVNEDINELPPGQFAATGVIPKNIVTPSNTPDLNALRPYVGYAPINSDIQGFTSNYNGLQVSVTTRLPESSLLSVNYTYSRALSDATAPQNVYDPAADWGPDASNRPQILNVNYVYSLPFLLHNRSVVGYILGGWELSGIVSFGAGQYLTAHTAAVDPAGQGILASGSAESGAGRPDEISNPNVKAPRTLKEWFNTSAFAYVPAGQYRPGDESVGSIKGPGYENWDVSLYKNMALGGDRSFQFRAEAYNVFNHVNFAGVSTVTSKTNYGEVTSTGSPRYLQLGAKFVF
ncbi:MAG: carboxypeptidase regulatory-like domain-containing protein [Acidobacteriota bacterium]